MTNINDTESPLYVDSETLRISCDLPEGSLIDLSVGKNGEIIVTCIPPPVTDYELLDKDFDDFREDEDVEWMLTKDLVDTLNDDGIY